MTAVCAGTCGLEIGSPRETSIASPPLLDELVAGGWPSPAERVEREIRLAWQMAILAARLKGEEVDPHAEALARRHVRTRTRRHRLKLSRDAWQAEWQATQIEAIAEEFERLFEVLEALAIPSGRGSLSRGLFSHLPRFLRQALDHDDAEARLRIAIEHAASVRRDLFAFAPELMGRLTNDLLQGELLDHDGPSTPREVLRP
jgi:hypothetical protein